jgi:hypothetical protein
MPKKRRFHSSADIGLSLTPMPLGRRTPQSGSLV